jgi:hypothetical protein
VHAKTHTDHPNEETAQSQLNQQRHTGSPENMRLASSWLADCTATHQECRSVVENSRWLPTRMLEVGTTEAPVLRVVHSVKLFDKSDIPKFAALSHCWGGFQHTSLLSKNVEEYEKGIPGADLSATIRDAAHVTRNLGLGYIWIDSLCIIQDSPDDWKRESATMMDVYGGSACTVVAAKASSGAGGCFAERDQFRIRPCKISNPFSKDTGISFCIRSQYLSEIYRREVVESSWYNRAWVFQERVLSPRLLIFGKSQMMWACQRLQASETWPCGKTSKNFIDTFDSFEVEKQRLLSLCSETRKFSKSDTLWWSFILGYTRANATKSSDRIIALQGIASRIQRATGQQYVAGMWLNETLPASLLWSAASPSPVRPTVYRAPTWSWASIDGAINIEQVIASISVTYIEILGTYRPPGLQDESIDVRRENLIISGHVLLRDLEGQTRLMIPEELGEPRMLSSVLESNALESSVLESSALKSDNSNQPKDKPDLVSAVIKQVCVSVIRQTSAKLDHADPSKGHSDVLFPLRKRLPNTAEVDLAFAGVFTTISRLCVHVRYILHPSPLGLCLPARSILHPSTLGCLMDLLLVLRLEIFLRALLPSHQMVVHELVQLNARAFRKSANFRFRVLTRLAKPDSLDARSTGARSQHACALQTRHTARGWHGTASTSLTSDGAGAWY